MSFLDGILSNPVVGKLAFGQLKGLFQEKNLDFICVRLDESGEIMLDLYVKGEAIIQPLNRTLTDTPEGSRLEGQPVGKTIPISTVLKPGKPGKKGRKHA